MNFTKEQARAYRALIVKAAESLADADAMTVPMLFERWAVGVDYAAGDRRCHNETLYECIQAHTSQSDWTPDVTPALWKVVSVEEWPEWVQPQGAHDAYRIGDKVSHNEKHWINDIDYNVYEPGVAGWSEAAE